MVSRLFRQSLDVVSRHLKGQIGIVSETGAFDGDKASIGRPAPPLSGQSGRAGTYGFDKIDRK